MLILPFSGLLAAEAVLAAFLCVPFKPFTRFGLLISGLLWQQAIQIVVGTCGVLLLVVLAFSGIRMRHLRDVMASPASAAGAASVFHEARQELYQEGIQSCLIVASLLLGMTIFRIDDLLRRNSKLQMNLDTMVKQAKGTQQEYMRQLSEKALPKGVTATGVASAEVAQLKKENAKLKEQNERMHKDVRASDLNVAAIKKQTEGLQLEFDRLLEENDSLRAQLSIFDRKYSQGDDKKRS